jgi:hypothetical protein
MRLLHGDLCSLLGEPEESSELGDMHLLVEIDRFEGSVLSEGDPERLERLVHEDLHAMLEPANGGHDLPAGGEAVFCAHGSVS